MDSGRGRRAGKLGASKQKLIKRIFNKNDNPTRQRLLALLLDSLSQRPGEPVSFVTLGRVLGISRQYVRHLYHQLKTVHPVPPVGKRGFGANDRHKRAIIAREGGRKVQALGKAHMFISGEASLTGKIGGEVKRLRHT